MKYIRTFIIFFSIISLLTVVLLLSPFTNWLYSFLKVEPNLIKTDAIVLLACEQYHDNIFGRNTYQRIFHTVDLFREVHPDKIIVSGGIVCVGTLDNKQLSIAEAIKRTLVSMGINESSIIVESSSNNTYESMLNVKKILVSLKINNFLLVTSSYHMFRSLGICHKLNMHAYPAPVDCYEKNLDNFALRSRFVSEIIREYLAIAYFRFAGWI